MAEDRTLDHRKGVGHAETRPLAVQIVIRGEMDAQNVGIIKRFKAGANTKELCRRHGISTNTFYRWKARFGGMDFTDVAKTRALEDENRRLKPIVANQTLEIDALKVLAEGNF